MNLLNGRPPNQHKLWQQVCFSHKEALRGLSRRVIPVQIWQSHCPSSTIKPLFKKTSFSTSCLSVIHLSLHPPGKSRPTISSCLWRSLTCWCRCWWCRSAPSSWSTSTGSTARPSAWWGRRWTSCWPLPPSFTCAASLWTGEAASRPGFSRRAVRLGGFISISAELLIQEFQFEQTVR